ncbi:S1 RNA-binding domain-containing protein [Caldalkalibacillus thermarum TA2.A1]|nr:S1 RNA-binding domain-containing protein [Caldalkalibacillus thermarum TA2.A1]
MEGDLVSDQLLQVLVEGFDPEKLEEERKDWQEVIAAYQNKTILQADLIGIESKLGEPCGVVQVGNIRGYIPLEHSGCEKLSDLRNLIGTKVAMMVLNYDRENDVFTASRKDALERMAEITWSRLKEGQVVIAVVRNVMEKILVVDIGGISVRIPASEIDYAWIDDLRDEFKIGDHLKVRVMEVDKENQKVTLSAKALKPNPYPDCTKRYVKGGEYAGKVTGVEDYGVFVNLEPGVDALVPHMRFERLRKGDRVILRVYDVNAKKERIYGKIVRKL